MYFTLIKVEIASLIKFYFKMRCIFVNFITNFEIFLQNYFNLN